MVKTRSSTKVPGGAPPHRLEVRLRSRETDRKGTTRSVQVQAALPMDTTDSETVTSGEKRERVVVGGEYTVPRKRARSVSPEPDKESSGESLPEEVWREDSEESEEEASISAPPVAATLPVSSPQQNILHPRLLLDYGSVEKEGLTTLSLLLAYQPTHY